MKEFFCFSLLIFSARSAAKLKHQKASVVNDEEQEVANLSITAECKHLTNGC
jgi:hypothetical protein